MNPSPCGDCIVYTMCENLCPSAKDYLIQTDYVDKCIGIVASRILGNLATGPRSHDPYFLFRGRTKFIVEEKNDTSM